MLEEMTIAAERHLRPGDSLARYAGDEVAIVLPDMDRSEATALAEKLRAERATRGVRVSVGVAQTSDAIRTPSDLLRAATPIG